MTRALADFVKKVAAGNGGVHPSDEIVKVIQEINGTVPVTQTKSGKKVKVYQRARKFKKNAQEDAADLFHSIVNLVSTENHEEFRSSAEVADRPAVSDAAMTLEDKAVKDLVDEPLERKGILANMFYC